MRGLAISNSRQSSASDRRCASPIGGKVRKSQTVAAWRAVRPVSYHIDC
jgi:hypothetical protein